MPSPGNGPRRRLRTVLCTRGGLFGAVVLQALCASARVELCGIVRSVRWADPGLGVLRGSLAYIRRSGLVYSLYLWSATTLADVLCGHGRTPAVAHRTRPRGPPVHATADVNGRAALAFLRACAPDLLVSAFFDQRLHEPALAIPRACLNVHPSLLPSFRGVDPVLQARLEAARTGVTIHYMTAALDSGAILVQRAVNLPEDASLFEATALLFREGAALLGPAIDQVERGDPGTEQAGPGSYQSWPGRAEVRALRARGGALMRLADLRRLVRS